MAFIQPCFIRKNTPELRKKLEELGYEPCYQMTINPDLYKNIAACNFFGAVYYGEIDTYDGMEDDIKNRRIIDCGDNEELFIALAALRDDTAKNQWFVVDNLWTKCYDDVPDKYIQLNGHKASKEEIIKHFTRIFSQK